MAATNCIDSGRIPPHNFRYDSLPAIARIMRRTEREALMPEFRSRNIYEFDKAVDLPRRSLVAALGAGVLLANTLHPSHVFAGRPAIAEIDQPKSPGAMAFIERAFEMRRLAVEYGDQAFGAIIVRGEQVIGQSWSRVILDQDPTAHAEMSAIRDTAQRLNNRNLSGAILYSSSRPCPMCEAAAYWAGIDQMIYGQDAASAGSPKLCR
ncbi:MAG: hypothetical protein CMM10_05340 [Rhodospirillaceae bacterium]|jgi:tRNA(Arg) A34 adenosine deaminase TadA|nr:hypothetical protein [Rhodospirillaceae bacterium]MDP6645992.1 nucleoside deaminase [Rhodospirillales bacterium]|tara:strand:- start:900 stop:1523 length:624 start_codon:yes stop_codon:yes gene_type:complete